MKKYITITLFLLGCLLLPCLSGCGKKNPDGREDVSGTITLNGQPLQGAAGIFFDPGPNAKGAGGTGQILSGKYLLTMQDGVKPGKYTVRISCTATFDKKTGELATPNTKFEDEFNTAIIPPEFNEKSNIEFEVVQGKKNIFDYDIKTDFKPQKPPKKNAKPVVDL